MMHWQGQLQKYTLIGKTWKKAVTATHTPPKFASPSEACDVLSLPTLIVSILFESAGKRIAIKCNAGYIGVANVCVSDKERSFSK